MVKIRRRVKAASGFYGKTQKTRATTNRLMYENGVYMRPSLLETA